MSFGINKRGTLGKEVLTPGPATLLSVSTHTYLGSQHKSKGVNFASSSLTRLKAANSILAAAKLLDGSLLPSWMRLTLYKTFICPTAEYRLTLSNTV